MATLIITPGTGGIAMNLAELVGAENIRPTGWGSPVYADNLRPEDAAAAKELFEEALRERDANDDPFPFALTIEIVE